LKSNYVSAPILTKANLINHTVGGYDTSSFVYKNYKTQFGATLAAILGVQPYVVYIIDEYRLIKRIPTSNGYIVPLDSPNCGFSPTSTTNAVGYSISVVGENYELTTDIINVKYNMSGQSINSWSPRQLGQVEWTYGSIE